MKTTLLAILLIGLSVWAKAQNVALGFAIGSGSAYYFENMDQGINVNFSSPIAMRFDIKYLPPNSYFDIKLRFQYLNSAISGQNWKTGNFMNGEVSTLTSLIILEHINNSKTLNFGYNFGLGYTKQNFLENLEYPTNPVLRNFVSANFSGLLSTKINKKLSIHLEPSLFWTDLVNTFRGAKNWQVAGEDLSFLLQLGIEYTLK